MMGKSKHVEPKLFYHGFSLESRVPADHILRKVGQLVDFSFVRSQVEYLYGANGHVSLDPAVILKLMFLLLYYNVKSERALMEQLPLRLDWLWFCGYDIDNLTPDHSVLSKARRRWGQEAFSEFFALILGKCIDTGLVDGTIVHVDSSMIDGNASKDSLNPQLRLIGQKLYNELDEQSPSAAEMESRTSQDSETQDRDEEEQNSGPHEDDALERRISSTDPDARLGKKYGQSTLGYKDHRAVDDQCGIITGTVTTAANINDQHVLANVLQQHEANTETQVKTVVADKAYGTIENYKFLKKHHATPCIGHQRISNPTGKFPSDKFIYNKQQDCFLCPAGQKLTRFYRKEERKAWVYRAERAVCEQCEFFDRCVDSPTQGRQVQRADDIGYVEWADACLSKSKRRYLMARRKYKAEGSFADAANNHGFKRARWRGLAAMTIQNLMVAAIQNLRKLLRSLGNRGSVQAEKLPMATPFTANRAHIPALCGLLTSIVSEY
jgi:transposase